MERNFEATNIKYGGSNPEVSKVYFTYGDLDPWKAVGVSNYTAEKTPTNYIPRELLYQAKFDLLDSVFIYSQ